MDSTELKHLEFIQDIITRMNTNSFQIKRLAVILITALVAFASSTMKFDVLYLGMFLVLIFWYLDTFFLWQEKGFRIQYRKLIEQANLPAPAPNEAPAPAPDEEREENPGVLGDMMIKPLLGQVNYFKVFFSKTLWPFYGSLIVLLLLILWYINGFSLGGEGCTAMYSPKNLFSPRE